MARALLILALAGVAFANPAIPGQHAQQFGQSQFGAPQLRAAGGLGALGIRGGQFQQFGQAGQWPQHGGLQGFGQQQQFGAFPRQQLGGFGQQPRQPQYNPWAAQGAQRQGQGFAGFQFPTQQQQFGGQFGGASQGLQGLPKGAQWSGGIQYGKVPGQQLGGQQLGGQQLGGQQFGAQGLGQWPQGALTGAAQATPGLQGLQGLQGGLLQPQQAGAVSAGQFQFPENAQNIKLGPLKLPDGTQLSDNFKTPTGAEVLDTKADN